MGKRKIEIYGDEELASRRDWYASLEESMPGIPSEAERLIETVYHARAEAERLRAALLAIGAEDWTDETLSLSGEEKHAETIGPCARARRALGIETHGDALLRRARALPEEYRTKRMVKRLRGEDG